MAERRKPARTRKTAIRNSARKSQRKTTARKASPKRWSQRVTQGSDALYLKHGVFTLRDPKRIAASLKRSAERSSRRKAGVLSWRRGENGGSKMKGKLITVFVGVFIVAVSWVPLLIVAARDRYAMPVGLGLLALAGSFVGGVIALAGVIRLVIHAARASKARS